MLNKHELSCIRWYVWRCTQHLTQQKCLLDFIIINICTIQNTCYTYMQHKCCAHELCVVHYVEWRQMLCFIICTLTLIGFVMVSFTCDWIYRKTTVIHFGELYVKYRTNNNHNGNNVPVNWMEFHQRYCAKNPKVFAIQVSGAHRMRSIALPLETKSNTLHCPVKYVSAYI